MTGIFTPAYSVSKRTGSDGRATVRWSFRENHWPGLADHRTVAATTCSPRRYGLPPTPTDGTPVRHPATATGSNPRLRPCRTNPLHRERERERERERGSSWWSSIAPGSLGHRVGRGE